MILPSFLTPYLPLGYLLLALSLFGGGVKVGLDWEAGDHAKQEVVIANAYLEAGRRNVEVESAAALTAAKASAQSRVDALKRSQALELEIMKDENSRTCRVSDGVFGVLNDAIDAVNGVPAKAGSFDAPATGLSEAGEPIRSRLGTSLDGWERGIRKLPSGKAGLDRVDQ